MHRQGLPTLRKAQSAFQGLGQLENSLKAYATSTIGDIGAISGAPVEAYERKVTIYSPARTASQQGLSKTKDKAGKKPAWRMAFSTQEKSWNFAVENVQLRLSAVLRTNIIFEIPWENPLIGWTSTADPLEHVARAALHFNTAEDAVRFCEQHGWKYEVQQPHERRTTRAKRYLGYGDNFSTKRNGLPDGGLISEGTAEPIKRAPGRLPGKI